MTSVHFIAGSKKASARPSLGRLWAVGLYMYHISWSMKLINHTYDHRATKHVSKMERDCNWWFTEKDYYEPKPLNLSIGQVRASQPFWITTPMSRYWKFGTPKYLSLPWLIMIVIFRFALLLVVFYDDFPFPIENKYFFPVRQGSGKLQSLVQQFTSERVVFTSVSNNSKFKF